MIQKTQYRTCQCESAQKVERQVLVIRGLRKRLSKLVKGSMIASKYITKLEAENKALKVQLETMKACDADKTAQLNHFYSERKRVCDRSIISPDRNFDSRPRVEG